MAHYYPYINGSQILISDDSMTKNQYTWANGQVIDDLSLIQPWLNYIKPGFTILDIGAQSGSFSLAAKFYPETTWYSFEPDLENYELLIQNLELNSITNVIPSTEALSKEVGECVLNIYTAHRGLNTLGEKFVNFCDTDVIQNKVKTNTIDNLFLDKQIDLIKIDTEGSEYDILMGGVNTIKRCKPKILMEYQEDKFNQFGYTCDDVIKLIEDLNYKIGWTDGTGSNIFIEPK